MKLQTVTLDYMLHHFLWIPAVCEGNLNSVQERWPPKMKTILRSNFRKTNEMINEKIWLNITGVSKCILESVFPGCMCVCVVYHCWALLRIEQPYYGRAALKQFQTLLNQWGPADWDNQNTNLKSQKSENRTTAASFLVWKWGKDTWESLFVLNGNKSL